MVINTNGGVMARTVEMIYSALSLNQSMVLVDQLMEIVILVDLTQIFVHLAILAVLVAVVHGVGLAVEPIVDQVLLAQLI
jgi:hypothetical protein